MANRSMLQDLTPYFLFLLTIATTGPLLFGYHLAELNAPSEVITCAKKSINSKPSDSHSVSVLPQCIPMNETQLGIVSSSFTLGGLIGALAAGPTTARNGRVRTMLYAALLATLGPVFESLAPNIGTMSFGRFISGLGAGAAMVVAPIYIFDIAPMGRKGFFGSFTQVMINAGILFTQVLGYFMSKGQLWRAILGIGGIVGLLQTVAFLFGGQESPKWTAENGNPGRAKRVLQKIRGKGADVDAEIASWGSGGGQGLADEEERLLARQEPLDEQEASNAETDNTTTSPIKRLPSPTRNETLGAFAVLRHPDTRLAVLAIAMVMLAQQLTGINSIVMYGVRLLSDLLAANSALLNVAVSALNVIMTACAAPLVDSLGRKTCLLMSITGMGINSVLLAIAIMYSIKILSAVAVLLFVASFALGLGPVPFILASELVPANAVGATQSWALAANWIATFSVAQFFPMLNAVMGKGQVYFIFAAFAVVFGVFTATVLPESKGKADADEVWGRKKTRVRED